MLFITNRVLKQSHRSRAGREVRFDLADNSALPSLFFCRRNGRDDYTEILSGPFFEELRASPAEQILLYLHGFNEWPEDNIFQKAEALQRGFDAAQANLVQVVPLVWPCAKGSTIVERYYTDQHAADMSGYAFARALAKLQDWQAGTDEPCKKRINVLAHSMGNRVFRETVRVWSWEIIRHEPPLVFRNAFLVAADVINETLERGHDGKLIPIASRNVVVYFAADDLALRASKVANARQVSRRLGHTGPEDMARVPANVYAKDCDNFNNQYDTKSGHTYFLHAPDGSLGRLLIDMIECVRTGRVPGAGGPQRTFML